MPPRALLATDLSDGSHAAARALAQVMEPGSEVHVAHVVPSRAIIGEAGGVEEEVRAWAASVGLPGAPVRVLHGEPSRALAKEAAEIDARIVALGSRGAGRVERLLLGSVARATLRRVAGRDLLLARPTGGESPRRILLGTDLTDTSVGPAKAAQALASRHGATLLAAHVVDPSAWNLSYDPRGGPPAPRGGSPDAAAREALHAFAARHLGRQTQTLLLHGRPAVELAEAAERERADLVIVGSHGSTGLERALLGSVAEGVVERAPASVLVVADRPPASTP